MAARRMLLDGLARDTDVFEVLGGLAAFHEDPDPGCHHVNPPSFPPDLEQVTGRYFAGQGCVAAGIAGGQG